MVNPPPPPPPQTEGPRAAVLAVRDEVGKVIVGQDGILSGLVAAMLVRGHVLLEGVPGVAKTLLVKTLAAAFDLEFKRVQFTPDLMPSDVIGQVIFDGDSGEFSFREGPVFTNLLLADEINRTPPKTQAALLEAMEERQVIGRGSLAPAARAVHRDRHPEPRRVRGHLPAARGAARPLPVQAGRRVPHRRTGAGDPGPPRPGHRIPTTSAGAGVRPVASAADLEAARREVDQILVEPPVLAYSWPSPGRPVTRRRSASVSRLAARPCCSTRRRRGPGSRVGRT